jgi:hypothetical protein
MVSMASAQGEWAGTVVTGLRRREAMVAPWKESFLVMESRRWVEMRALPLAVGVRGGVGGSRSLAASQSSSTNC